MEDYKQISVLIPCYHSEHTVEELLGELDRELSHIADSYEIIAIDDGSADGTSNKLASLCEEYKHLRLIQLSRNYGQHNAILCGLRAARYPLCVTLDDDLQHPPQEIKKLITELQTGDYDVVYGYPQTEEQTMWRRVAATMTKLALSRFMGATIARRVGPFRAFRTHLRDAFADYSGSFVSLDVLLTWASLNFGSVPIQHNPRESGESNYTIKKLVTHALNLITGFSILPLQLASLLGFTFCGIGVLLLFYVLITYFVKGVEVRGFTFLATAIASFSGIQLLALGVIGEYVARIHFHTMGTPSYSIRKQVPSRGNSDKDKA